MSYLMSVKGAFFIISVFFSSASFFVLKYSIVSTFYKKEIKIGFNLSATSCIKIYLSRDVSDTQIKYVTEIKYK